MEKENNKENNVDKTIKLKPTIKLTEEQREKAQRMVLIEMRKKAYLEKKGLPTNNKEKEKE